ncbi:MULTISPECIES: SMP-30/gluconolactonase/LRE family protein [Thermocrispum]|uniref:SMP-30/gluconolactonase/LRE family protein n=1 Tax=Thermocrispum agreste TaxID=37925 RepID=A0A2W4L9I6_9PSEU|nr:MULTISPECIES: SMP-30/gluconolactonase/LRE family protein [Thermocrispum]PZM92316.1 MAG: strictosidine synthase [Thermocrispum agreste]
MSRFEALQLIKEFLFPGRHSGTAIPPLDGGLTPNDALEEAKLVVELPEPDDVLLDADQLYVTSGNTLLRMPADGGDPVTVAEFGGEAGALARLVDGRLLVAVAGVGVVAVTADGRTEVVLDQVAGRPLRCPTDFAVAADGSVLVTDGSSKHAGQQWVHDLMECNRLGRLVRFDPDSGSADLLADELGYASGVTLTEDGAAAVVSEAWTHRISTFPLDGGQPSVLKQNLPGYPGRLQPAAGGGYWLAMFALRTQLVEFVLTQRYYVEEMMRTIEPDLWIRPALRGLNSGLEPLQGGQIRKLGVVKPWAPPRSYGLAVRLDPDGYPASSLHSRGGGSRHGVTSVRQCGQRVLIASRGGDCVVEVSHP